MQYWKRYTFVNYKRSSCELVEDLDVKRHGQLSFIFRSYERAVNAQTRAEMLGKYV